MTISIDTPRDKRIPLYFVAFFLFLALVDGIMVTIAIRTHTGTVTDHPYEKGLAYNQVVQAASIQENLGWKGNIGFKQTGSLKGMLSFHLEDKEGKPLLPGSLRVTFTRPTQKGIDFELNMDTPSQAITFPVKGAWEVRIYAHYRGADYQQSKRIVVE